jgi:L-threonylcarbamoyladenylate synthase
VIDEAVAAIRAGKPVILPTDTVYGLCTSPHREEPVERLSKLKGRDLRQPIALLASDLDTLFECVPELRGRAGTIARALLPGAYTLVLPNPGRRFRWMSGMRPDTIGVRVPNLPPPAHAVVTAVGCVVATSANHTGGADPRTLDDVPDEIRSRVAAEIDIGPLPGLPSTVIDFTVPEPVIVREGAGDARSAIQVALAAVV